jgi:hypothetical protein
MQLFNGLAIDQIIERQSELFLRILVVIEPYSRENECYVNCMEKVARDGGAVVVGWRRTCATIGAAALIATLDHHAVWKSPEGELIDVSPRLIFVDSKAERVTDNVIDFMVDPTATFDDPRCARDSFTIPMAPDIFGYLKKAFERMDQRAKHFYADEISKANYEGQKIEELLNAHIQRIQVL